MVQVNGARGKAVLPHAAEWAEVKALVLDGVEFAKRGGKPGAGRRCAPPSAAGFVRRCHAKRYSLRSRERDPTPWTILQHDGPNHLGLCDTPCAAESSRAATRRRRAAAAGGVRSRRRKRSERRRRRRRRRRSRRSRRARGTSRRLFLQPPPPSPQLLAMAAAAGRRRRRRAAAGSGSMFRTKRTRQQRL